MKNIMLLTGEPSGDIHSGQLINELKKLDSSLSFWGFGGDNCLELGMEQFAHVREMSVMGLMEVIPSIPRMKKLERFLVKTAKERKPECAILVDYPGFNLSIAPKLKKLGIPIVYYISPQIWAWHESRVNKIKKVVDRMIVILPFEVDFYKKHDVEAIYAGHPFSRIVKPKLSETEFRHKYAIDKPFILLLPGSRRQEVTRHLPLLSDVANKTKNDLSDYEWVVLKSPNLSDEFFNSYMPENIKVISADNYSAMKYAHFGLVASGSATLECAVSGMPFFVVYRTSNMSYNIFRHLVKVDMIGLANLVAGEIVAKEFIQHDANAESLAKELVDIIQNDEKYHNAKKRISIVSQKLRPKENPSENAARIVYDLIK